MAEILMVDDQTYFKELLADELAEEGHSISAIHDVENLAERLNRTPVDMVLLDLFLDAHKGWEVLDSIKAERPYLPVVILTAYNTYRDDPRLSEAAAYVVKSLDFKELKQTIAHILEECRTLPQQMSM